MQTIELNGRPIAVMGGSRDQAEEFAETDAFRANILTFVHDTGRPVWDGQGVFSPSVRDALSEEVAIFERSLTWATTANRVGQGDPTDWLVFLMDVRETAEDAATES